ncbi:MAG: hypothetical protein U0Z53_28070 [Blastocatellia bacterium]
MKALTPKTWTSLLKNNDAALLWQALNRLVTAHPLVRSAQRNQNNPANPAPLFSTRDLTQDLYVTLLEKSRFDHYLSSRMSDAEIEREIFQIELTNLLIGRLRRQRPENYRIIRRINQVLESSPHFRVYEPNGQRSRNSHYRHPTSLFYGLTEWPDDKRIRDSGTFQELITEVAARLRNRRLVGCRGEAQVIITSQELTELMVEIFTAIDSPASLNTLRSLALSKLPVYDVAMTTIEDDGSNDDGQPRGRFHALASAEASPEQITLREEQAALARRAARDFLDRLSRLTRSHDQRTERFWRVLWHCYFDPAEPSQLSIAEMVGISDSSVSDYRRRIESEMRKLGFEPEQLRYFAEELDEQLRLRLKQISKRREQLRAEKAARPVWPAYSFNSLASIEGLPVV